MTATSPLVDEDWGRLRSQVRGLLRGRLAADADADDVAQDVLLRVLRTGGRLRDEERFGAWLSVMVRNATADLFRARQRSPLAPPDADARLESTPPAPADDDDDAAARRRVVAALRPFAERLPAIYREVIILSELDEVPHAEIARRLAISISGVKSRVQRGRAQLHRMLTACCEISLDARHRITDCVPRTEEAAAACCAPTESGAAAK